MKKTMLLLAIAIVFASCSASQDAKYLIKSADGFKYYTNNYTVDNGCVQFKCDDCGNEEQVVTICGSFTLTKFEK